MRFMRKHNYVMRTKTNEAMRVPQELAQEVREFLEFTCPLLFGPHCDRRWIFNMDQTPLHFPYHNSKTLEKRETKTIHVRKTGNRTKRATRAFTITAAGDFLTPIIIYKGKPNGHITTRELPKFNPTSIYACQEATWMDERCMLMWINEILSPYLVANPPPPGIQPIILLNSYRCHMMALVANKIFDSGIKVIHIPGGCTALCQPLDIGVNKPFKQCIRHLWEEWMMVMLDQDGVIRKAMHKEVAEWMASVYWNIVGSKILKNAWRKMGYNWFEGVVDKEDNDHNANGDGDSSSNIDGNDNGDGDDNNDIKVNFIFDDDKGDEDDIDEDFTKEGWDIMVKGGA